MEQALSLYTSDSTLEALEEVGQAHDSLQSAVMSPTTVNSLMHAVSCISETSYVSASTSRQLTNSLDLFDERIAGDKLAMKRARQRKLLRCHDDGMLRSVVGNISSHLICLVHVSVL